MQALAPICPIDDEAGSDLGAPESILMIGNFDGVHRGHQAVLAQARDDAKSHGWIPGVLTFAPHPGSVVGGGAPPLLTTLARKAELMSRAGVMRVYVRKFDRTFAAWSPERFARELVSEKLRARIVVVGSNFRFGAKRQGDLALLRTLGAKFGFDVQCQGVACDEGGPFSSTRVRDAIAQGDLAGAANVLGRPHAISGIVGRGAQRGRQIGFPTVNMQAVPEMLPPNGVYAVLVDHLENGATKLAKGVMNIGVRPTLEGDRTRTVEAHLFDVDRDLYGANLRIHLIERLRDEVKFPSLDALKAQIGLDRDRAKEVLSSLGESIETAHAFG